MIEARAVSRALLAVGGAAFCVVAMVGVARAQQAAPPASAAPASSAPAQAAAPALPPPPPAAAPAAPAPPPAAPAPAPEIAPSPAPGTPMPPTPAIPPPPPPAAGGPTWDASFAVRVGVRLQDPDQPQNMSELHLDSAYDATAEARFHGKVTDYFEWFARFNATLNAPTAAAVGTLGVMDLIAAFKAADEFQIWAGRLLVPSDRSNFSGPFFMSPWNYPGFYFAGAPPLGPHDGPTGRDQGVTVWGNALDAKFKYYAGVYGIDQGSPISTVPRGANPYFSGRVSYSLQGSEPGYFGSSTYYGAKNVVTIGAAAQYQKNAVPDTSTTPPGVKDSYLIMADALAEENVTGAGTFTLEGQFYKFSDNTPFTTVPGATAAAPPTVIFAPKEAFYVVASYLTPENIGVGKIQPLFRIQHTIDPAWNIYDVGLAYIFKDYSGRIVATYQHIDTGNGPTPNALQLGVQLQTL